MSGVLRKLVDFVRRKGLDREGVRYVIVGGLTTLVNFGLFALICIIMGIDVSVGNMASIPDSVLSSGETTVSTTILFANLISISASIVFAYFANKLVVFRQRCSTRAELALEFAKFVGSRLFTMAIEIGAVWLFVDLLAMNALIGKAVSQVLVIILNYIISKLIVFRSGKRN